MLEAKNVSKKILGKTILNDVSFKIEKGTVTGLVGRNGAGKTSLLRTLIGIMDPDEGAVLYNGKSVADNPTFKEKILYVPDSALHFKNYTIKELSQLYLAAYPDFDLKHFHSLLDQFNLSLKRKVRHFSKGMKALLHILITVCTNAELIMLDEPTNGLDPIIKRQILQLLIDEVAEREISLLISTHHLYEVEQMADHIIILENGEVESAVSLEDVKSEYKKVQIAFHGSFPDKIDLLPHVTVLNQAGRVSTVLIKDKCGKTVELLKKEDPIFFEELPMTLEDVFVTKIGGDVHVS